jgi:hypothetical protein
VKLFARNQFTRVFEETDQDLNRLPFKPDFSALLLELARTQIKLEDPESPIAVMGGQHHHGHKEDRGF